jgi:hypothetical protein
VNEGVNIPPRGQSSPLGASHAVKSWPKKNCTFQPFFIESSMLDCAALAKKGKKDFGRQSNKVNF